MQKAASSVEDEEAMMAKAIAESKAAYVSNYPNLIPSHLGIRTKNGIDERSRDQC